MRNLCIVQAGRVQCGFLRAAVERQRQVTSLLNLLNDVLCVLLRHALAAARKGLREGQLMEKGVVTGTRKRSLVAVMCFCSCGLGHPPSRAAFPWVYFVGGGACDSTRRRTLPNSRGRMHLGTRPGGFVKSAWPGKTQDFREAVSCSPLFSIDSDMIAQSRRAAKWTEKECQDPPEWPRL